MKLDDQCSTIDFFKPNQADAKVYNKNNDNYGVIFTSNLNQIKYIILQKYEINFNNYV